MDTTIIRSWAHHRGPQDLCPKIASVPSSNAVRFRGLLPKSLHPSYWGDIRAIYWGYMGVI